ncbi:hypothetical protein [Nitrospina watsonii]|uniref:Exonuclease SbcC n=1 Tax=Nitrospina watsonii TaxID=1323948 RepID=A0ABM9HDG7_9BACT|nr:hypothetical protein [Nitrospina watsonii]CAI2718273.1 Exonuclease SbcC [Nitrospina watsonii]
MNSGKETARTIHARLKILGRSLLSEQNSVQYYQTLLDKTPSETEEQLGERKMYEDLHAQEESHVQWIRDQIEYWAKQLKALGNQQTSRSRREHRAQAMPEGL